MDKNQYIGMGLLVVLLTIYMYINTSERQKLQEQKKQQQIEQGTASTETAVESKEEVTQDSIALNELESAAANDTSLSQSKAQEIHLKNNVLDLTFTTQGAYPQKANLTTYKTFYGDSMILFEGPENFISLNIPFEGSTINTQNINFTPVQEGERLNFIGTSGANTVEISYSLPKDEYMMDVIMKVNGKVLPKDIEVLWQNQVHTSEQDLKNERTNSAVYYKESESGDVDFYTIKEDTEEDFDEKMDWLSIKPTFFNSTIISKQGINNVKSKSSYVKKDSQHVSKTAINFSVPRTPDNLYKFRMMIGPNSYDSLKTYGIGLEKIIPMGRGIFEFVKYINRGIILPIFEFLSKFISNYGIIIMLLTLFIRTILSFFTYKSYLSQAKMQALKPELEELKAKYKDDQQTYSTEQMKLYQKAGVNPLGGCLPSLLQLPFLIAMYSFFPSALELRQKAFLWCKDLSTYDSILSWDAQIPLLSTFYGNHISLFTILLTVSSLALALYSSSMTADQNNPALKYLPYVMPVMFLGFFNNMAAGLTFYYFFSNIISLTQQYIIKRYVIKPEKIRAKIEENKKKPKKASKFAQRLEEMQKQNEERKKKVENAKNKGKKKP